MLKVWGRRSAFNVQKVLWALGELGLEYEHVEVGGDAGGLDAPAFRELNPHGRIPVLEDDGVPLWESHTILRYLGARYGAPGGDGRLWPEDPMARSLADRWMDWSQCELQGDFMTLFWAYYRTPEAERDAAVIERAHRRLRRHHAVLDAHLAGQPFLGGEHFTLGDVPAGTSLYRYFEMGVEVDAPPNLRVWYDALAARPAFRESIMVPFDELRGKRTH